MLRNFQLSHLWVCFVLAGRINQQKAPTFWLHLTWTALGTLNSLPSIDVNRCLPDSFLSAEAVSNTCLAHYTATIAVVRNYAEIPWCFTPCISARVTSLIKEWAFYQSPPEIKTRKTTHRLPPEIHKRRARRSLGKDEPPLLP